MFLTHQIQLLTLTYSCVLDWILTRKHNKYGSVKELRSTFGHLKSFEILA